VLVVLLGTLVAAATALTTLPTATAGAASAPTWAGVVAPVPPDSDFGAGSSSDATACAAPGSCVSVGEFYSGGVSSLDADTLTDGQWTSVPIPSPPNPQEGGEPYFRSIACPSVTWCTAYGYYTDPGSNGHVFASTLAGGTWTTSELPLPPAFSDPEPEASNLSLACPAAGWCVAVGDYQTSVSGQYSAFIDTLSGGSWSTQQSPAPVGAPVDDSLNLQAVACYSTTACAAVGSYEEPTLEGMLVSLTGTTWSAVAAPEPSGANPNPEPGFFGVSCPAPAACVAVGDYDDTNGYSRNIVETQSGATWTVSGLPSPPDAIGPGGSKRPDAGLNDVSCPTVQWCVAVGTYTSTSAPAYQPEVATFAGGAWTVRSAPGLAPTDNQGNLDYVSCSWPGSCVAGGAVSDDAGYTNRILIDTLTAGTWTGNDVVIPPGGGGRGGLSFVDPPSCIAGTCLVGGSYVTAASVDEGLLDTYSNLTGYQEVASDGGLFAFSTPFYGSMGGQPLVKPVVGMAVLPDNGGYYQVASDGGIFAFGAPFFGSMGGQPLNKPIVGIAFDTLTGGYYEVASDGGIFAFNAPFFGSMGGQPLNKPIVGIAFDPTTGGYYEVASDGGIFAFNAPFQGSMGGQPLNKPIVGITVDPATGGYFEVASDGGIFAFNAPFQGSMGGKPLAEPVVGIAFDYATGGYYEVASDGGLFAFDAPFQGSMGGKPLNKPIVGMTFG